ncbi:MAG: hypothetical protein IH845_01385 [Nanoarchaeota archaeon]|nr:hypothetical protein [Nanoarchaeota archaeon]
MVFEILANGKLVMDAGIAAMPLFWRIWISFMTFVSFSAVFFIKKREARWSLVAIITNIILMFLLANYFGFEKILSLGHLPWLILLIYLFTKIDKIDIKTYYGKWCRLLMGVISISLVIDIIDVARYFIGI